LNDPHKTRSHFGRQLQRLKQDVLRMGVLVENSCLLASQALFDRNLEAANQIAPQDKQIDRYYRQIEQDCVTLLALQAPVSTDLRLISAIMQLVRDLERIGDYAKDLGDVAFQIFPYSPLDCMDQVKLMSDRTRAMLSMSLSALSDLNAQSGLRIKVEDDAVDTDYETLYRILAQQHNVIGSIEPYILLVLVIRYLERMADHATNIGQRVAYIVTGQR
jgi:phosphate transport system protein